MPKRSNDFQKLVLYLNKHKHPNVEIVESKELIDNVTLETREVDIFITTSLGNYKLNISTGRVDFRLDRSTIPLRLNARLI